MPAQAEMAKDLEAFLEHSKNGTQPHVARPETSTKVRRVLAVSGGLLVLAIAIGIAAFLVPDQEKPAVPNPASRITGRL